VFGAVEVVVAETASCAPDAYLGDVGSPGGSGGRIQGRRAESGYPLGGWFPAVELLGELVAPGFELRADVVELLRDSRVG
jgi:hypothetical protein